MKTTPLSLPVLIALFATLFTLAPLTHAQVAGAPGFVDYQGTVFDGTTGAPLGSTGTPGNYTANASNYTMEFKVYDQQTGGTLIWAETQTVTVALGNFSVRLGSGVAITGLSPAPIETSIINAFNQKDRYLEVTVIIPPSVTGTPITPRLAFQASPFSFVAERAKLADEVNGKVTATANSVFTGGTFNGGTFGSSSTPANVTGTLTGNVVGNVTGTASNVTGVVAIGNGGTGSSSKNFVDLTSTQTGIAGNKTFTGRLAVGANVAPTDTLQVYGATPGIRVSNTDETYSGITFEDAQGVGSQFGALRYDSGSNNLSLFINNNTPKVTVETSGNLKFGPTANLNAVASNRAVRIVFGYVSVNASTGAVSIGNSSGDFTVTRTAVGKYTIRFTAGTFSSYPIVTANSHAPQTDNFIGLNGVNTTTANLECWDNDNQLLQDSAFMFTAIGFR